MYPWSNYLIINEWTVFRHVFQIRKHITKTCFEKESYGLKLLAFLVTFMKIFSFWIHLSVFSCRTHPVLNLNKEHKYMLEKQLKDEQMLMKLIFRLMQLFRLYLISTEVSPSVPLPRLIWSASSSIFNHWNLSDLRAKMKFSWKYCCTSAFPLKCRNAEHTRPSQAPCLHVNEKETSEGNINFI